MLITVKRIYTCNDYNSNGVKYDGYTIGHLYIDEQYICDTLEDTDRMLDQSMSESYILSKKKKNLTAIPTGTYRLLMNVVSPKYSKKQYYMDVCKGRVPRVDNVKGFDGILIHAGNTAADTSGCLLVGYNKVKGKVLNSKIAFEKLYAILKAAYNNGQDICIEYKRTY